MRVGSLQAPSPRGYQEAGPERRSARSCSTFANMALHNIRQPDAFVSKVDAGEKLLRCLSRGLKEFGPDQIGALVEVVSMLKMTPSILQPEKVPAAAEVVRVVEEAQRAAAN